MYALDLLVPQVRITIVADWLDVLIFGLIGCLVLVVPHQTVHQVERVFTHDRVEVKRGDVGRCGQGNLQGLQRNRRIDSSIQLVSGLPNLQSTLSPQGQLS